MNIPDKLLYTKEHEWIRVEGDEAYIGITDYAQEELGDIVFVEIDTVDEDLTKGDVFGTVEAVKTVSDLYMPVDGKVLEMNGDIDSSPEMVNKDPFGKGWMIKIKIADKGQLKELLNPSQYSDLIS